MKDIGMKELSYNREQIKSGIVHFGVGGFHRSHQAFILDQLIRKGEHNQWGICGVGLLESDKKMEQILAKQDNLYTLIIKDNKFYEYQVVGAIVNYIHAPSNSDKLIEKLVNSETKIVSLTVTEGGYYIDDIAKELNINNTEIQHDLKNPEHPKTIYGYLTKSLKTRFQRNIPPFTIMSCDNIQSNGDVVKKMLVGFIKQTDPTFANWIAKYGCFPNSMVDRITPQTTESEKNELSKKTGIVDEWPVVTEPFYQWVIEDQFSYGRPDFEKVNVKVTKNVIPYEKMKIRLLNASHQLIGFLGILSGLTFVHEVLENICFEKVICKLMNEVTPTLNDVPGVNLNIYKKRLIERFLNAEIKDRLSRICSHTGDRIPKFLCPSIDDAIEMKRPIQMMSFTIACWILFLNGKSESGKNIQISQGIDLSLKPLAMNSLEKPSLFLAKSGLFSERCKQSNDFVQLVTSHIDHLKKTDIISYIKQTFL